jgi:prepilin-type N-terminal cleavage/methylation domain-containing protein
MRKDDTGAFTLIEMLVVIAIIATIAAFAVPALTSALTKGQMTGTMNNARQLYLAGYQMALDGSANGDANLAWPGDFNPAVTTLKDYVEKLVQNDYLKTSDLAKMLSAPGSSCTATGTTAGDGTITVTLSGNSGLKVYPVKDSDGSNTIFAVSSNYTYDTALATVNSPYGDKGFVVIRKGGDGSVLRKNNATATSGPTGAATYESTVGKKPGEAQGTVTAGDPTGVLKFP